MASVDFMKLHGASEAKSKLRHCDKKERLKNEHSNLDINKSLTINNYQFNDVSYEQACRKYDEMIAYLDKQNNSNKRKDRVTMMALEIPCPADMAGKQDMLRDWFADVKDLIAEQYGAGNIIADYVHVDEIHPYVNKQGQKVMSREHMHVYCVPEHNGKLNGKWFSSRGNMTRLNDKIQEMTLNDYGMKFMDGTKSKGKRKVEELKRESMKREEELILQEKEILSREKEALTKERKGFLQEREEFVNKSFDAYRDRNIIINRANNSSNNILKKLKNKDKEQEEYEQIMQTLQKYINDCKFDNQTTNEIAILMQRAEMFREQEKLEKREQFSKEAIKNKIEAGYEHSL